MKHLLIILTILLLSYPLIGDNHKGETLYLWTNSSGLVWKGFGEKSTNPKYQGHVENGEPSGLGVLTFPDGSRFVGEYKDGKKNGQGIFTFSWGGKYVGSWKNGKVNSQSQGTLTLSDGSKFVGENMLDEDMGITDIDDKKWNGIMYDKNGNILVKFVNGKEVKK